MYRLSSDTDGKILQEVIYILIIDIILYFRIHQHVARLHAALFSATVEKVLLTASLLFHKLFCCFQYNFTIVYFIQREA